VLGVALVILSILGIAAYSYKANRAGALALSEAVLDALQARIAREVSSYLRAQPGITALIEYFNHRNSPGHLVGGGIDRSRLSTSQRVNGTAR